MRRGSGLLAMGSIILALAGQPAWANLVANGDFDDVVLGSPFYSRNPADVPGWTHTGAPGYALLWGVGYADPGGNISVGPPGDAQFASMGGTSTVPGTAGWSQTVSGLTIGQQYQLRFYIADEVESPTQTLTASVVSGATTAHTYTVAGAGNYWKNWVPEGFNFTAGASSAVLDFSATNQLFDIGLGEVSLNPDDPVPEPASLALFAGGLLGLGWVRRRARI